MLKVFNKFSVNRYYRMSDGSLEEEAHKWKIQEYGYSNGGISRQIIIDALLKKDNANNARYAFCISVLAIIISMIALFL